MAHDRVVSKELSAFADQFILVSFTEFVKGYLWKIQIFFVQKSTIMHWRGSAQKKAPSDEGAVSKADWGREKL